MITCMDTAPQTAVEQPRWPMDPANLAPPERFFDGFGGPAPWQKPKRLTGKALTAEPRADQRRKRPVKAAEVEQHQVVNRPTGTKTERFRAAIPGKDQLPPLLHCRREAPQRPPSWRWYLAARLLYSKDQTSHRFSDMDVLEALRFQRWYAAAKSEQDYQVLLDNLPWIYQATEIWQGDDLLHSEIEARLLASEDFNSIAAKTGVRVEIVGAYERMFFNVLDRLNAPSWVTNYAIGKKIHHGLTSKHFTTLWKAYGYWGGPLVLDSLIYQSFGATRPTQASDTSKFFRDDIWSQLQQKVALAVRTMSLDDPRAAMGLLRVAIRMKEIEGRRKSRHDEHLAITANLDACLTRVTASLQGHVDTGVPAELREQFRQKFKSVIPQVSFGSSSDAATKTTPKQIPWVDAFWSGMDMTQFGPQVAQRLKRLL